MKKAQMMIDFEYLLTALFKCETVFSVCVPICFSILHIKKYMKVSLFITCVTNIYRFDNMH